MSSKTADLEKHRYINLETYKKSGQPVQTPVWFTIHDNQIFVTTTKNTGKVKRIKNNQDVKIMPCGMRGEPKGEWISGRARFAEDSETTRAIQMRNKKYGFRAKMVSMFIRKGEPVVFAIQI